MVTIRRFDQRAVEEFHAGNIPGGVHTYIGQEAVAVGVCAALRHDDKIVSTHRGHGHTIAKGADIKRMMAEIFGRTNGYCHGKGGSGGQASFPIVFRASTGSAAAEIAALLSEDPATFRALKAPPKRVCAPDVPIPYSPVMERFCIPDKTRIIEGIREVLV